MKSALSIIFVICLLIGCSAALTSCGSDSGSQSQAGMRKDFVATMNSYEAFVDEYVSFMKKYKANPSDAQMISQYSSMMSRYADFTNKFNAWKNKDLNSAELNYYSQVLARTSKKLASV
ncbi:MAG: hypothetical protein MJ082_00450 [Clostridia bacterium]|nr:hypothetical protein [Clostridia bacterium]